MNVPDTMPEPGSWVLTSDGSQFEIIEADPSGPIIMLVDSGETTWTPWSDVERVGTADEVEAWAAEAAAGERIATIEVPPDAALVAAIMDTLNAPRDPVRVDVLTLTIRHDQPIGPTPGLLYAIAEVVASALALAGIEAECEVEDPGDPEDGGEGCHESSRADGHHRISDSLCADCLEFV